MVHQPKGLNHCRMIKRRAKQIWKKTNWQRDMWNDCLKTAINDHRRQVEAYIISESIQTHLALSSAIFIDRDKQQ